ncbi:MAG: MaoC/PaaZ C-terminal domain-containing protein [Polyangiaceae bacterium]
MDHHRARDGGNFGGPRPPADAAPSIPKDRAPDFTAEEATSPEQALLYRLSGDVNPLHADPELARERRVPAGAHPSRAVHLRLRGARGAPALRAAAIRRSCARSRRQFRKPVWPGDTIVTQGWDLGGGQWALTASVKERPDAVLTSTWAEIG